LIQDLVIFQRVLDFFDEESVPTSLFVIPRGEGGWQLDQQDEWLAAAQRAEQQGHNCQLHGLDHAGYEFGSQPRFVFAMGATDPDAHYRQARAEYGHLWHRELYVEKLQTAIGIFENSFGRRPQVFRTGALSQTPELYDAVADVGMRYVSNQIVNPLGWEYIAGRYDSTMDWDPGVPPQPYYLTEQVINLPMISEYAWQMTAEKVEPHLALALEDMGRVYEADGVFVLICHVQEVGAEHPYSRIMLHRFLQAAREQYEVSFMTLRDLVTDIESNTVPVLEYEPRATTGGYYDGN
jgi:peptidoglycan/xylan/chitin deacetylase (PgdA/CDA1 family)